MTERDLAAEVVQDRDNPRAWRVEFIDGDGGCEVAVFYGPNAESRAQAFRTSYYRRQ